MRVGVSIFNNNNKVDKSGWDPTLVRKSSRSGMTLWEEERKGGGCVLLDEMCGRR